MANSQSAVLTGGNDYAIFLVVNLRNENGQAAKQLLGRVHLQSIEVGKLFEGNPAETILGVSPPLARSWLADKVPKQLLDYTKIEGPGGVFPVTQGDLFAHFKANSFDKCFEIAKQFVCDLKKAYPQAEIEETHGFANRKSHESGFARDLSGFEDGLANPKPEGRPGIVLILNENDPDHFGASYAITQKWIHNLHAFNSLPLNEQENVIGRTKEASAKIKPTPPDSHIAKTFHSKDIKGSKIFRQSMPFGTTQEHGLFFVGYTNDPHHFHKMLIAMAGADGTPHHDRLMKFSTPISGAYWYIPSNDELGQWR